MTKILLVEGIDGSGKSTVINLLQQLAEKDYANVEVVRDPGTSVFGERIRDIVADKDIKATPLALSLAFMAARTELAKSLSESVADLILLDRYWPSTVAYQCFASGVNLDIVMQHVRLLDAMYPNAYIPRQTSFCLSIDPMLAHERRMADKGRAEERFKAADMEFKFKVAQGYAWLCDQNYLRPVEVGPETTPNNVADQIWSLAGERFHYEDHDRDRP